MYIYYIHPRYTCLSLVYIITITEYIYMYISTLYNEHLKHDQHH